MEHFTSPFRPFAWKSLGRDGTPSRLRHKYLYQAQPRVTLNVQQEGAADLLPLLCAQPLPRPGGELSAALRRMAVLFCPPCRGGFYPRCLVKSPAHVVALFASQVSIRVLTPTGTRDVPGCLSTVQVFLPVKGIMEQKARPASALTGWEEPHMGHSIDQTLWKRWYVPLSSYLPVSKGSRAGGRMSGTDFLFLPSRETHCSSF